MRRAFAAVPVVAIALCMLVIDAARAPLAQAQEEGQEELNIAGSWVFDANASDNARDRLNAAMRSRGNTGATTGGRSGRASGRAGGGSRGGRGGGGAMDPPSGGVQVNRRGMSMLQGPRELRIEFTATTVILQRDGADPLELTTDDKSIELGPEGNTVEYKAKWDGKKLEVETRVEDGPRVTEKYEMDRNDPGVLKVEVRFVQPGPGGNLNVRLNRVYNRG